MADEFQVLTDQRIFNDACIEGNFELIEQIVQNIGACDYDIEDGVPGAITANRIDVLKFLVKHGANLSLIGLFPACYNGNIDIINYFIEMGASNWDDGLYGGIDGGKIESVKLMLEKGYPDIDYGLIRACGTPHLEIVKLLIDNGACSLVMGIREASRYQRREIVKYLIVRKGYIPESIECLNTEELYYLYKMRVGPSSRYLGEFTYLRTVDDIANSTLDNFTETEMKKIIKTY